MFKKYPFPVLLNGTTCVVSFLVHLHFALRSHDRKMDQLLLVGLDTESHSLNSNIECRLSKHGY